MTRGWVRWVSTAVAGVGLVLSPVAAHAHAVLLSSTPGAHQVVQHGKLHVVLTFNSRVDGARSSLQLVDGRGNTRPLTVQPQNGQNTVEANVGALGLGAYTLRWQALASDGHITRGQIPFEVR